MKALGFKKIYAAIFAIAALVFGILVTIDEKELFSDLKNLTFDSRFEIANSIATILWVITDILIIAIVLVELILLFAKPDHSPFKVIRNAAEVVAAKYVLVMFIWLIYYIVGDAPWEAYKEYFFGSEPMIVPLLMFVFSSISLSLAEKAFKNKLEARIISTIIGSALAITGLIVYFGFDGYNALVTFGLILAIVCYGGLVAYFFIPQTKEE